MPDKALDVVCLGDSLTYGYPFGPEDSWVKHAARAAGIIALNKGVNGETTEEMLGRFEADVISHRPRAVTILGGTNDAWMQVPAEAVAENVEAMAKRAVHEGIVPVVALPPPLCISVMEGMSPGFLEMMARRLDHYRTVYRELAQTLNLPVLDFYTPMLDPATGWGRAEYFFDDAHPSIAGYRAMGEAAAAVFREVFTV